MDIYKTNTFAKIFFYYNLGSTAIQFIIIQICDYYVRVLNLKLSYLSL